MKKDLQPGGVAGQFEQPGGEYDDDGGDHDDGGGDGGGDKEAA